jgi:hypothetical protein
MDAEEEEAQTRGVVRHLVFVFLADERLVMKVMPHFPPCGWPDFGGLESGRPQGEFRFKLVKFSM